MLYRLSDSVAFFMNKTNRLQNSHQLDIPGMLSLSSHGQSMSLRTFLRLSHDQFVIPSWSDIPQPKLKSLLVPSHR